MKNLSRPIAFVLCLAIIILMPLSYKITTGEQEFPITSPTHKCVLTLWNIDVFEGGIGSRSDFLAQVSVDYKGQGVIVMVISHTEESAQSSIKKGELPDMISYGVGVDCISGYAKSLPEISFLGGEIGGKFYAYPWCAGGYFLIRKNQENRPIDRLFVSQNTYNIPFGGVYYGNLKAKEILYKKPIDAYVDYLSGGSCDALLGTQRDIKRLEQRGVEFYPTPIDGFSDLVQYVSVLTSDKQRYGESVRFLEFLISEKIQKKLNRIGMASVFYSVYSSGDAGIVDFSRISYTVSPFTDSEAIDKINSSVLSQKITNSSLLDFKNVLKHL
ncbi:MAG: hypothetical protein IKA61_00285 [Clostridia bacterium]|nr:hypothetical protein [Clostridia bacterium]